jgi:hypothetical protein
MRLLAPRVCSRDGCDVVFVTEDPSQRYHNAECAEIVRHAAASKRSAYWQ